jgi:predicted nuclease of predicted toxin-antitoxin system
VKFLIDQNRSPRLAELLRGRGHDAAHTTELGLERAEDSELLELADREDRIVVSGDTDFGTLLALSGQTSPSFILFRSRSALTADQQAALLLDHLDNLAPDLEAGAVVVVTDERIRIRRLPLLHDT